MILILGGGLAGLSAAWHLARRLPDVPRLILEKESEPGGLCRSAERGGFVFDFTGHYLHLRDPETTRWVLELLGGELEVVARRAEIHCRGKRLPFPFQAHLHGLDAETVARCLVDFVRARERPLPEDDTMPFGVWARRVFGDGIAEAFLIPYNAKLFCADPDELTAEWVAWAVPRPSLEQVVRGALGLPNHGLGYNPTFRYPRRGGIGRLAAALAEQVGADLRLGAEVEAVDVARREVRLAGGERLPYERIVSTIPLPSLLRRVTGDRAREGQEELAELAGRLRWTAVDEVRIGVRRASLAGGAHWIYFPEPEFPFYRVGFPSNVCPAMAPPGCSSISVEFARPAGAPVPEDTALLEAAREGLARAGILEASERPLLWERAVLDPAYVLFDRHRTPAVGAALARLERHGILSIGRFGAWTYSYMERALIDGRQAAERVAALVTA
ncbi:MAG: FAD-dependent oxidoreductase [Acidobacteria bacterium]|nr:MAG: FAD-dependent oxidoreductase [Acidobacteriota bacterium]